VGHAATSRSISLACASVHECLLSRSVLLPPTAWGCVLPAQTASPTTVLIGPSSGKWLDVLPAPLCEPLLRLLAEDVTALHDEELAGHERGKEGLDMVAVGPEVDGEEPRAR